MAGKHSSRICELASTISSKTSIYNEYLVSIGHPDLSFSEETPPDIRLPRYIVEVQTTILEANEELQALILGPMGHIQRQTLDHTNLIALHAIFRFRLAETFPVGSEASYSQIAKACRGDLSESQVRRIIRYTTTKHLFAEPRTGVVVHTASSRVLAESQTLRNWVGMVCEEMWPSAAKTVDAMEKWLGSEEPEHTGFAYAHGTGNAIFAELAKHPERARRFASAMTMVSQEEGYEPFHLLTALDSCSITPSIFVDIGGSHGMVGRELAANNENVHCIVQDLPDAVAEGRMQLPPHLGDRVEFMEHDFFNEQPVKGADVYFFRWIFHDWSDKYCVRLLRALIPALKTGARVIISDFTVPPPGAISRYSEWLIRAFDLAMLELFNSKEREAAEWIELFRLADERFHFVGITLPPGSKLSFVEARWKVALVQD